MAELKALSASVFKDCAAERAFWNCNGVVSRNIHELTNNIAAMNDWQFTYHVNKDNHKNDFAKWIWEVLGDEDLAERLHDIYEKDRYVDIIRQRINELENH